MIIHKLYAVCMLVVVTLLVSCSNNATSTASPVNGNTFTNTLLPLVTAPENISELKLLTPSWQSGPVWAIKYLIDTNNVVGVYGDDGRVVRWSVDGMSIINKYDLGIAGPKALQFSADGKWLIGATGHILKTNEITNHPVDYVTSIAAWNVDTGKLIKCLSFPCYGSTSEAVNGDIDAIVNHTGRHVFIYNESSISVLDLVSDSPERVIAVNSPDFDYWWNIGNIAYDDINQRYAIIYQEGQVEVNDLIPNSFGSFDLSTILTEGEEGNFLNIPAAMFDPTGKWLSYIRGDHLFIWDLGQRSKKLFLEKTIADAFSMDFDQTGKLLFVIARDKIIVLDISQKTVIAEYPSPNITSLNISPDNRLLVWGDEFGAIHIWGIKP